MCVRAVFICVRNMSVCLRSVLWDRLCLRADSPSRFGNLSLVMRRLFTEMRVTDKGSETSHTHTHTHCGSHALIHSVVFGETK